MPPAERPPAERHGGRSTPDHADPVPVGRWTGGDEALDDATLDVRALTELAAALATAGGALALAGRRSLRTGNRVRHDTKSSAVDPVTEFDRAAEALIVERIIAARPDDAIVGEEGADRAGTSGVEWHVDPIDGTVNFLYDLPSWCTSVAAVRDGRPIAAAIHLPVTGELFTATAGAGAFVDGQPIAVTPVSDLAMALVSTGFSYDLEQHRAEQSSDLVRLLGRVRDIRRLGSAAIDLAMVAAGRVDAYLEAHLNSWDIAAGALLVAEAGGVVTAFDGSPLDVRRPTGVFAAAPGIADELRSVVDARRTGGE
jgi:myo-inositol-1(or 4)-monophosphatase